MTRESKRSKRQKLPLAPTDEKLAQAVREMVEAVPWGHHVNLLTKLEDPAQRLYYLKASARFGWSRNVLLNQIKAHAYERSLADGKAHNFASPSPSIWPSRPKRHSKAATTWSSSASVAKLRNASLKTI